MDRSVSLSTKTSLAYIVFCIPGQVVALFIVGLGEYGVVWLGTDWDLEIQRGIERNQMEAKQQARLFNQE